MEIWLRFTEYNILRFPIGYCCWYWKSGYDHNIKWGSRLWYTEYTIDVDVGNPVVEEKPDDNSVCGVRNKSFCDFL